MEKAHGSNHALVATVLDNLALLYDAHGGSARAEPLYLRALAIREKALGPDHPDVAYSLNNVAAFYMSKGDGARAEPMLQRALAIWEKTRGSLSPPRGPHPPEPVGAVPRAGSLAPGGGRLRTAADIQDRNASAVLATGSEDRTFST